MTLLVAVKSCRADLDRGYHDVIRSTWGQALRGKALVRFFVGHAGEGYFMGHPKADTRTLASDEVVVDAADDYNSLPHKTRGICAWAISKNVDRIFLCDTDTYVKTNELLKHSEMWPDYIGKISEPISETFPYTHLNRQGVSEHIENCYPWASGGFGYFLSRDAAFHVADNYPKGWAEDLWVGQVLGPEIARGRLSALTVPAGVYSYHHPQHGEIYDEAVLKVWMDSMYRQERV